MFERINVLGIIVNHFRTLRNLRSNNKKIAIEDLFLFIIAPIMVSTFLVCKKVYLDSQVSNLIAIISIFGGFLFNLLAIIYGYLDKVKDKLTDPVRKIFAKEINANISFNILLSIFTSFFLIVYNMVPLINNVFYFWLKLILLGVNYFLLILFGLTLLMVLNRVYILLQKENE